MAMKSPKNEQHDTEKNAFDVVRPRLDSYIGPECEAHT